MIEPRSSFVTVDGLKIHYLEWDVVSASDNDNVPLILLHGLGSSASTWRLVANELCEYHGLVAFDLRGHGLSDQPEGDYDLVTIAEDIISAMAALGLGQVAIVGHGWGARVGLVLTARHPALVSHLVLVDCPFVEPRHWPDMTRERFINERLALPEIYQSRETYIQAFRQDIGDGWTPQLEPIILAQVQELPDGSLRERLLRENEQQIRAAIWEDRALSYYGKISCPVLLVPAASEPYPGDELPEQLESNQEFAVAKGHITLQVSRAIQQCDVHWMPETGHHIQLHRPHQLAQAILSFLQR